MRSSLGGPFPLHKILGTPERAFMKPNIRLDTVSSCWNYLRNPNESAHIDSKSVISAVTHRATDASSTTVDSPLPREILDVPMNADLL